MNHEHLEQKKTNRAMFLQILENIRFLARQGLPLRNVVSDDSNFGALFSIQSKQCSDLKTWVEKNTNKNISHDIQNECLKIMSSYILRKLSKDIHDGGWFTIMADECTDVANKEQFTIYIRWINQNLEDHEYFIGLYEVEDITSDNIVHAIKDTLLRMNLSVSNCRGQCYDGTSNMSGHRNGVSTQITAEESRALYTHCYAHSLNLAVSDAIKQSKMCQDALDTAYEIIKLIKFSPKRNAAFDGIKNELSTEDSTSDFGRSINKICATRWTVHGESVCSILNNYCILMELWEQCLETRLDPDVKGRIIGVKIQMTKFDLLFGLQLCERILCITDSLSKTLQ